MQSPDGVAAEVSGRDYADFAGGHPAEIVYINSLMTLNLYKAIEESKINATVINPISNCTYPSNADIQKEENWWDGSPHYSALSYASARRMIYPISLAFHQQHGIKSNVNNPNNPAHANHPQNPGR